MANSNDVVSVTVNGETYEVSPGTTVGELARRAKRDDAVGARLDGEIADLRDPIDEARELVFLTFEDDAGRAIYWHTTAHVLAQALKRYLDDPVRLGVGPPVDEGFYYDFDLPRTLTDEDLQPLEHVMRGIIEEDLPIERTRRDRKEARKLLRDRNEDYKVELLEELEDGARFYRQGEFEDLCRGPHLRSTGDVGSVRLTKLSGAYWRGDQDNPEMQRVYGISFPDEEQLEAWERRLEEAKKRDHRRLGQQLGLFHIDEDVGPGLVIWRPRGSRIRSRIESYWRRRHRDAGYELVHTPHVAREELWEISGHLGYYEENMFPRIDMGDEDDGGGEAYRVKPMNCPFHMKIFRADTRSYRDLPIRLAELGTVYRNERSGVLHGLLRVRGFTQDDAHIFCRPDQVEEELRDVLSLITDVLSTFGFTDYEIFVSTRPERFVGSEERWEHATGALRGALERAGLDYEIDPGEGVFYGPKIDLKIRDSLDREWQCSTIQVDFNLPERFEIEYVDDRGEHRRPIMIHRALFGSLERFFGCLVEHYGGAFPPWLAPTPVWLLPISEENRDYADALRRQLEEHDVRASVRDPDETLGRRIRRAQTRKIPYTFILGSDEEESGTVEVRAYGEEDSRSLDREDAVDRVVSAIRRRLLRFAPE